MKKQNLYLALVFTLTFFTIFESKAQFGNLLQKAKEKAALATSMLDGKSKGNSYKETMRKLHPTTVGFMAPDFTQNDPNGNSISLSSFKGKYVLLDFWASWCGPCRRANPDILKVYDHYKTNNFTILGVSLDRPSGREAWLQAIKDDGLTWNHVSDLKYWDSEVAYMYSVTGIPQNFLIDPSGKIIAKNLSSEQLESTLAQLLN